MGDMTLWLAVIGALILGAALGGLGMGLCAATKRMEDEEHVCDYRRELAALAAKQYRRQCERQRGPWADDEDSA